MVLLSEYGNIGAAGEKPAWVDTCGAAGFLHKPLVWSNLLQLLHAVLSPPPVVKHATPQAQGGQFHGYRVLLVEDNEFNQQIALELLGLEGISVDVALHGQDALDLLLARGPTAYHLVLMDLEMPVLDGQAATLVLRQDERFADLPVVAMTAHALLEMRERSLGWRHARLPDQAHRSTAIAPSAGALATAPSARSSGLAATGQKMAACRVCPASIPNLGWPVVPGNWICMKPCCNGFTAVRLIFCNNCTRCATVALARMRRGWHMPCAPWPMGWGRKNWPTPANWPKAFWAAAAGPMPRNGSHCGRHCNNTLPKPGRRWPPTGTNWRPARSVGAGVGYKRCPALAGATGSGNLAC